MGCRDCKHDHWQGGDRVCALKPYDVETPLQRSILVWLGRPGAEPFTDAGCPGFEDFRKEKG